MAGGGAGRQVGRSPKGPDRSPRRHGRGKWPPLAPQVGCGVEASRAVGAVQSHPRRAHRSRPRGSGELGGTSVGSARLFTHRECLFLITPVRLQGSRADSEGASPNPARRKPSRRRACHSLRSKRMRVAARAQRSGCLVTDTCRIGSGESYSPSSWWSSSAGLDEGRTANARYSRTHPAETARRLSRSDRLAEAVHRTVPLPSSSLRAAASLGSAEERPRGERQCTARRESAR